MTSTSKRGFADAGIRTPGARTTGDLQDIERADWTSDLHSHLIRKFQWLSPLEHPRTADSCGIGPELKDFHGFSRR